ncbi:MAG TPA: helix-turn-helix domain-containing protein [Mycobacterium sp.]|jgi:AcrR family transcriptional regulator|nr:helix-turn-helix domain-containing protein [Mycobacterium sp.]
MLSISNVDSADVGERILDAAASCVRDFGVDRVTLAEIARRAGVSRPTVYRRWPDTRTILASLLTDRVLGAWNDAPAAPPVPGHAREALVRRVVDAVRRVRADDLILTVLRAAPELAMVYIADRLGTSQQALIDVLAEELRNAQRDKSVRCGDPRRIAAMVLLITQSVVQSGQIVAPILDAAELDVELSHALNAYLAGSPND